MAKVDLFAVVLQAQVTIGAATSQFRYLIRVGVDDLHSVVDDPVGGLPTVDLQSVPVACWAADPGVRRDNRVQAAAILVRFQIPIAVGAVVQDLHFDTRAVPVMVATAGDSNVDA